jgi:hypothetical protein
VSRDFMVDLLRAGKTVSVGTTEILPAFGAQAAELRGLLEHLAPWLRNGSLKLFTAPQPALLADRFQPRVLASRSHVWLTGASEPRLFAGVIASQVAELPLNQSGRTLEIEAWLGRWQAVDVSPLIAGPRCLPIL